MASTSKKSCLVQLSLVYCASDKSIFTKKVRICGFPSSDISSSVAYVKEINYPPQKSTTGAMHLNRVFNRPLTDLSYPRIDLDLAKSLEKFDYVIVGNSDTSDFIYNYIKPTAVIINIDNVADNNQPLSHHQRMQPQQSANRVPSFNLPCYNI